MTEEKDQPTQKFVINYDEQILVTGAAGFIGRYVVGRLLDEGFNCIRCLVRETSDYTELTKIITLKNGIRKAEIIKGNLLSRDDCSKITDGAKVIYHLAAGTGTKSFSEAFLNSVVTTRNLIEAALGQGNLKRFVNVSSFTVYTNIKKPKGKILDETGPVEASPETRAEAYCYGKVKQDELVISYGKNLGLPYVIIRPGTVYGPGKIFIPGRIGISTFGIFLHFGGSNPLPLTYVENCAEAIVLTGLIPRIEGQVFNIVDDDLSSSRHFLQQYKKKVRNFRSLYVPKFLSYLFCASSEKLAQWSKGQIPPALTRREWVAYWKKTYYSNEKLKNLTGWKPRVSTAKGLKAFFESCGKAQGR